MTVAFPNGSRRWRWTSLKHRKGDEHSKGFNSSCLRCCTTRHDEAGRWAVTKCDVMTMRKRITLDNWERDWKRQLFLEIAIRLYVSNANQRKVCKGIWHSDVTKCSSVNNLRRRNRISNRARTQSWKTNDKRPEQFLESKINHENFLLVCFSLVVDMVYVRKRKCNNISYLVFLSIFLSLFFFPFRWISASLIFIQEGESFKPPYRTLRPSPLLTFLLYAHWQRMSIWKKVFMKLLYSFSGVLAA